MATVHLHLTHLVGPRGLMDGAVFTVEYGEGRQANVSISDMPAILDEAPYKGLRAELRLLAKGLSEASHAINGVITSERRGGSVIFEGRQPFELIAQQSPTARGEGSAVMVTLPVFVAGAPSRTADIQVILEIEHAEQLASRLQPALTMARVYAARGA
jgi:hypothetical protein